jgi:hypothetical protein
LFATIFEMASELARRAQRLRQVEQFLYCQRAHVQLEQFAFHAQQVNEVGRIDQVLRRSADTDVDDFLHRAHPVPRVDHVRSNDQLVRFVMDEPVRVRTIDAVGMPRHLKILIYHPQPRARAGVTSMRDIIQDVKPAIPRHQAAHAAFRARRPKVGALGISGDNTRYGRREGRGRKHSSPLIPR